MNKRAISLLLVLIMILSIFVQPVLALESITDDMTSNIITETATDSNAQKDSNNDDQLEFSQIMNVEENKSFEDIDITNNLPNNEILDNPNQKTDLGLLDNLNDLIENTFMESSANNLDNIEEDLENLAINDNISAIIPNNSINVLDDLGIMNGFVTDISKVTTFSLRNPNNVTLKTPQYEDGTELSVIHFVESVYHISDDAIVLNISDYSNSSKELLEPAITAYQEYFETSEECVVVEIFDTTVDDGTISFETSSFSIFAIGQAFLNTFEFYVGNELVNTQYIIGNSNGEGILLEPEIPTTEDSLFKGWKIEGTNKYQEFGIIKVNMSEHTTIKLYADIEKTYHVYFYYEAREGADILETLSGKPGDIIYTEKVDYPLNLDKHVISWHTDIECLSPDVTEVVVGNEDIVLYPKVEKGFWVTFYTEGGFYIDPMFYAKNETLIEPPDPYKEGYEFIGWFDENGNQFIFNGQIVTESVRLTARYEAQTVNYTVQIVIQNPNKPDKYDPVLGGMFTKQGVCGDTIQATDITIDEINSVINKLGSTSYFKKNLEYFYYSSSSNASEMVELESDGSSVLYIYYDRYMTELRYYFSYEDEEPWNVQSGLFDADMPTLYWLTPSEEEYPNFGSWESSPNLFPAWTGKFDYGFTWDTDNEVFVHNVYATKGAENGHYFYSYVQAINPDGTVPDVGVDITNMPYRPHVDFYNPNYSGNENNQAFIDNWSNINFETASKNEISNNDTWLLYETQNLPFVANMEYLTMFYDNEWYNGFTAVAIAFDLTHKESGKLTDYRVDNFSHRTWPSYLTYLDTGRKETGAIPGSAYKENGGSNFYYLESDKWYAIDTPFKIVKFHGDGYFRFLRNQFNLKFVMDDEVINEQDVYFETDLGLDRFTSISDGLIPPAGYIFGGWFTSPQLTEDTRFNLETNIMPANDMILYGKWTPIYVELDVHVTIDGTDEIIEGFNGFTVKYGSIVKKDQVDELKGSVNVPDGAIWYGWYEKVDVGGGKELLVPFNFDKQLIEDLVLYPFYSYMDPTKVIYDLNGGVGTTPIDIYNYAVGKGAVVLDCPDIIAPEGKVFLGWNTKEDGTGLTFRPNDIMRIAEKNPVLYALYGDVPDGPYDVSIKYINTVSGEEIVETYQLYDTVFIKNQNVFTIPIHRTYIFKEFNTKPDGTGIRFNPNDEVYLTTEGENVLYAIYEKANSASINIPIIKHFKDFQPTDELFTVNGYLSDETGDLLSEQLGVICFKYQGNETESMTLEMVLDLEFFEPNKDYYIKIFETQGESMILYDSNYYLLKFTMENISPTILSIEKCRKNGETIESFEFEDHLEFTNILTLEADRLPDMGGNGTSSFRMIGLIVISLGCFIVLYYKKLRKL